MKTDFIEQVRARRSIRKFTERTLTAEQVEILKETLLRAPSSRNLRAWEFIFVAKKTMLEKLSFCKPAGSRFLAEAALGIVVCVDETKDDVWVEDGSIASVMVQFAAQETGLGSCWIQVRNRRHTNEQTSEEYIRDLLNLPEQIRVLSIIAIGFPVENPPPVPMEKLLPDRIHAEKW